MDRYPTLSTIFYLTFFVSITNILKRKTWQDILFQIFSISTYISQKSFLYSSTRWISLMASKQKHLVKKEWSKIFYLNLFDRAILGLVNIWLYPPLAILASILFILFFLFRIIFFPFRRRLIFLLYFIWNNFNGISIKTKPEVTVKKSINWKIKLFPKLVLASSNKSFCS